MQIDTHRGKFFSERIFLSSFYTNVYILLLMNILNFINKTFIIILFII